MEFPYCIYGASGHSKVILEILENCGRSIHILYDDDKNKKQLLNYKVTNDKKILTLSETNWIVGIGNNLIRKKIVETNKLHFGSAIDKSSNVSKRVEIGVGTVIMPGATINTSTVVGNHVIINTNSSVDHDCVIEDFVHISPNATLCGSVFVAEGTHIGAGSVLIPGVKIGRWCMIGAGSVIIRDVPDFSKVVGNPGRIINAKN